MISVSRLRTWFAVATIFVLVVVAGFYLYAKYRFFHQVKDVPAKLGIEIQQSTDTFSLSKSEGGRTLFTIRASKALQYKQGGHAELHNVNIIVYGKGSNRFDQIYGDDFEYDPQSGNVVAKGVVHIDLEANPGSDIHPELGPPKELKNPIHLKTSGMVFNRNSGIAKTDEEVSFQIPQASGSARGAYYDSKSSTLTLGSNIVFQSSGENSTKITARHGTITKDPRRAVLEYVTVDHADDTMTANKATLLLRDDNSLERILAEGNVRTSSTGQMSLNTQAPRAEFLMNDKNQIHSAIMTGGVIFDANGANQILGNAGRVVADFGPNARVTTVHTSEGVKIQQKPSDAPSVASAPGPRLVRAKAQRESAKSENDAIEITAQAMDFFVKGGRYLDRAETLGAAQISITPQNARPGNGPTIVTAAKFRTSFSNSRLSAVHGAPQARIVQSSPGQPDKISTSDSVDAVFDKRGAISGFVQQGNFQYHEGQPGAKVNRAAWGQKATYNTASQVLTLEGSPRVTDGGMATTAQTIRLNRATGDAEAQNAVKTTYSELTPQPGGALLASSEPVHVTATRMVFTRSTGLARYTGEARLWQAANIVEAPVIVFDRSSRSMDALGSAGKRVTVVLVQQDKKGNATPVSISAARLVYTDPQRLATFYGGVTVRTNDGTMSAERANVFLKAHEASARKGNTSGSTPSELDRIIAEGRVVLQQPNRRGTGEKLVYTADDAKFVLTGGPPSIFDAQQGTVTGASLTFYSHDDRVLVEGAGKTRAVTKTRVSK